LQRHSAHVERVGWRSSEQRQSNVLSKIIIIGFLVAILYSLASSFYFLVTDKGEGDRAVRRLSWRVGLSLLLVIGLYVSFQLGWVEPRGVNPVRYPSAEGPTDG
jgi:succinate dehydrogenase/fumarate reductase cytochrome b subunit